jgi:uncharacterized protein YbjT (DUF2867 family)
MQELTLVTGGSGKTGRRLSQRLTALGRRAREIIQFARQPAANGAWGEA